MSSSSDPKSNVARALELIEAEKRARTGMLDLGNLQLTNRLCAAWIRHCGYTAST